MATPWADAMDTVAPRGRPLPVVKDAGLARELAILILMFFNQHKTQLRREARKQRKRGRPFDNSKETLHSVMWAAVKAAVLRLDVMDPNGPLYGQRTEELDRMSQMVKDRGPRFAQQVDNLEKMYVTNGTHTELHRIAPVWDRGTRMYTRTFEYMRVDSQMVKLTRGLRAEVNHAFERVREQKHLVRTRCFWPPTLSV